MGWFSRRKPDEARAVSYQDVWSTGGDVSSISANTVESALRLAPLYSCVRLIADQAASLPLKAYRQNGDVREVMASQPPLLVNPSARSSLFTWKQQPLVSLLLRGNAYGYITAFSGTAARSIEWLNPDAVAVDETTMRPIYRLNGQMLDESRVVHVAGLTTPGSVVGVSPLTAFRTMVETGLNAQQFTRNWFVNGGPVAPGSHLKNTERTLDPEQSAAIKDRYKAAVRSGDVLVTGSDWDLTQLSITGDDAAFVQTMRLNATQIASVYGVPPEMVGGETASSLTYSTVELNSINFVTYTLRPWLVRLEEALSAVLPQPQFCRFNVDALLRADTKSRYEAHAIAIDNGFMTRDEVRVLEDRPPLTPEQSATLAPPPAPDVNRSINVDARTFVEPSPVSVTTPKVDVDARPTIDARTEVHPAIDATTHIADGAVVTNVDARTEVPPATPTRKRVETDERGHITAIIEERDA